MRVLVAISILAFLALLWASIAIFRHIRRTQRRRRRALEASRNTLGPIVPAAVIAPPPPPPAVPEITFNDPEAPLPEIAFTDSQAPIREATPPAFQPYVRAAEARQPAPSVPSIIHATKPEVATANTVPPPPSPPVQREPSHSPLRAWPHFGFTPASPAQPFRAPIVRGAEPELTLAAQQALEDHQASGRTPQPPAEPIPYAAPSESSASVAPARLPLLIHPPAPAIKPVYPSPYPAQQEAEEPPPSVPTVPPISARSAHQPINRADWAYFNKDMGDLSDPVPAPRRSRIRSKNSE